MIKLVIDENIPNVEQYTSQPDIEVLALPAEHIDSSVLKDVDALCIRSATAVNQALLQGTAVRFVGTVTAGIDHVDTAYLAQSSIQFNHAPGCNAEAVVEYALSALVLFKQSRQCSWESIRFGIIGYGAIGQCLVQRLSILNIQLFVYDPWQTHCPYAASLHQVLSAQIISIHAALEYAGAHPSYHMIGRAQLALLASDAWLINTARGAIIHTAALIEHLAASPSCQAIIDVWESTPMITPELQQLSYISTAHIAGHSIEAKQSANQMIYTAFCHYFHRTHVIQPLPAQQQKIIALPQVKSKIDCIEQVIQQAYDIRQDAIDLNASPSRCQIKQWRAVRTDRHSFSAFHFRVASDMVSERLEQICVAFGCSYSLL